MKTINDIEIREEHFRNEKYNFHLNMWSCSPFVGSVQIPFYPAPSLRNKLPLSGILTPLRNSSGQFILI
jgi:hypothetical protein